MLRLMMTVSLLCFAAPSALAAPCLKADPRILTTGATSPCDGVLLSRGDSLLLETRRLKLELAEISIKELTSELEASEKLVRVEQETCREKVDACDAQVKVLNDRLTGRTPVVVDTPLVERPWFVATLTFIVTAAIAIPVTWLAVTER